MSGTQNEEKVHDIERRLALLEQVSQYQKDSIDKLENNNSKLVWIVVGAVVLAGLNIIMGGGPV